MNDPGNTLDQAIDQLYDPIHPILIAVSSTRTPTFTAR
ncbi:UNVERIFIED_ORG: hypothetical protein L601_005100000030 [Gordonia westfalica J30]